MGWPTMPPGTVYRSTAQVGFVTGVTVGDLDNKSKTGSSFMFKIECFSAARVGFITGVSSGDLGDSVTGWRSRAVQLQTDVQELLCDRLDHMEAVLHCAKSSEHKQRAHAGTESVPRQLRQRPTRLRGQS